MSRYDKNAKLYEKVKNNDYHEYNSNVKDYEYDIDVNVNRAEYQEKKRLSLYFNEIEKELKSASKALDEIQVDNNMEMKPDIDLKSLIEHAKQKSNDDGLKLFSNTQHEILSSLEVDESEFVSLENLVQDADLNATVDSVKLDMNFDDLEDVLDDNFAFDSKIDNNDYVDNTKVLNFDDINFFDSAGDDLFAESVASDVISADAMADILPPIISEDIMPIEDDLFAEAAPVVANEPVKPVAVENVKPKEQKVKEQKAKPPKNKAKKREDKESKKASKLSNTILTIVLIGIIIIAFIVSYLIAKEFNVFMEGIWM